VTGVNVSDPTYLHIYTDDDNVIAELRPVAYRAADFAIKTLIVAWSAYLPEGSPEPAKDVALFKEWLLATYGSQTYAVAQQW
jgi:hypothetical protein